MNAKLPKPSKFYISYRKKNGRTGDYVISAPIDEVTGGFTAYAFGRGVRTFLKTNILKLSRLQ